MGDRAAAGADRVHVDHRHHHREAGDPGVARRRLAEAALRDDADIGRGAADIEGDQVALARQPARPVAADHAGGRAGQQGEHRPLGHHRRRRDAAVRRHDAQVGLEAARPRCRSRACVDVVAHLGPDEGVHRRRGEALELAELRRHRRRGRGEALRDIPRARSASRAPRAPGRDRRTGSRWRSPGRPPPSARARPGGRRPRRAAPAPRPGAAPAAPSPSCDGGVSPEDGPARGCPA